MDRDNWLPVAIGAVLVAAIGLAIALWKFNEAGRPVLTDVRIISGIADEAVLTDQNLTIAGDEAIAVAVALRVSRRGEESWLAPSEQILIDGQLFETEMTEVWPEEDRFVRVFWFTVECDHMGGELNAENADKIIHYRSFLAPELGRGMVAQIENLEPQNDDEVTPQPGALQVQAGTIRLYARVEIVEEPFTARALQSATSIGVDGLEDGSLPEIRRQLSPTPGLNPVVGELFWLPGFELPPESDADAGSDVSIRERVSDLVARRIVSTSHAFASLAATGEPDRRKTDFQDLGRVSRRGDAFALNGSAARWNDSLLAGDLLNAGRHWIVLVSDDGNGVLDDADTVAQCWRRPPAILPFGEALEREENSFNLLRHVD